MPITHTNAKGKTYYLPLGTMKTGKLKYYFYIERNGRWQSVSTIPILIQTTVSGFLLIPPWLTREIIRSVSNFSWRYHG